MEILNLTLTTDGCFAVNNSSSCAYRLQRISKTTDYYNLYINGTQNNTDNGASAGGCFALLLSSTLAPTISLSTAIGFDCSPTINAVSTNTIYAKAHNFLLRVMQAVDKLHSHELFRFIRPPVVHNLDQLDLKS